MQQLTNKRQVLDLVSPESVTANVVALMKQKMTHEMKLCDCCKLNRGRYSSLYLMLTMSHPPFTQHVCISIMGIKTE